MDNVTKIETKYSDIYVYYRDENNNKKVEKIEFENYYFIELEQIDEIKSVINDNIVAKKIFEGSLIGKKVYNSIYGKEVAKLIPNKYNYWKTKNFLRDNNFNTYEANIDVYLKYLMENPTIFLKNREIGIIDIETDLSVDSLNTPKSITSITLYSYKYNKYFVFSWHNELKLQNNFNIDGIDVETFFYNDEILMLNKFVSFLKDLNLDVLFGYNSNEFDIPYIINRMFKLNMDINLLSNFGEVTCRRNEYSNSFYTLIPGLNLLDVIPILKKCTCYQPQPASFSLYSVANFYLKDNSKKLDTGAAAWNDNIDDFIKYNVNDVLLVKKIIDNYELINFLSIIQSEIIGVDLENCTHNSIILLYLLKNKYPEIKLLDNMGFMTLNNTKILTKNISLKAATVLEPIPGLHENVIIYDFSGLYPSIFRTLNISPDTINDNEGVKIDDIVLKFANSNDITFSKYFKQNKVGLYPSILNELVEKRNYYKKKMKSIKEKNSHEKTIWTYRSDVVKQINNSLFGVGGYSNFQIFNPYVSAAVTSVSREILNFVQEYCKKNNLIPIFGDTDSLGIKVPKNMNEIKLGLELNKVVKEYVLNKYEINESMYCMEFEFQRKMKKFLITESKKKYFGIEDNGDFYYKGFALAQHSYSHSVKKIIEKIFIMLLNKEPISVVREEMKKLKIHFKKLGYRDVAIEWRISKNLDEYDTNTQHIRAARYSNEHFNTNFRGGSVGKILFVNHPMTNIVMINEDTKLSDEYPVDYETMWEKIIISELNALSELHELKIQMITSKNRMLDEFYEQTIIGGQTNGTN